MNSFQDAAGEGGELAHLVALVLGRGDSGDLCAVEDVGVVFGADDRRLGDGFQQRDLVPESLVDGLHRDVGVPGDRLERGGGVPLLCEQCRGGGNDATASLGGLFGSA